MISDHEIQIRKLAQRVLRSNEKRFDDAQAIYKGLVQDRLTKIHVVTLIDLYQVYLPAQNELDNQFRIAKDFIQDRQPNEFAAIKNCHPSANEYAAISRIITAHIRMEIEKRAAEETCPNAIDSNKLFRTILNALEKKEALPANAGTAKFYEVQNEIEVFYAPVKKDEILERLARYQNQAMQKRDNDAVNYFSEAIKQAHHGRFDVYGKLRNYEHYNAFAESLARQKNRRQTGFNQTYFNGHEQKTAWKEKQVDARLTIRAMELLQKKQNSFIVLVVSDADFVPLCEKFFEANQKFFIIYVRPTHEGSGRDLAKAYLDSPAVNKRNIIEIDIPHLMRAFLDDMGFEAEEGAALHKTQENSRIYQIIGKLMKEDHENQLKYYEQQELDRYNEFLKNDPPY